MEQNFLIGKEWRKAGETKRFPEQRYITAMHTEAANVEATKIKIE